MWETGEGDTGTGCRRSLGALLYSWSCFPSPGGPRPARDCPTPSEGGPEGCTRLVTEEEAALASRLSLCLSALLSRLGNWDGNWERDPSHPQRASPCGTPDQRGMFPRSYFRVLKSPCRAGASTEAPSCSGTTEVRRRSSSLSRDALTPMFLLQKTRILAQTVRIRDKSSSD